MQALWRIIRTVTNPNLTQMRKLTSATYVLVFLLASCLEVRTETVVLSSGKTINGTIIRTNGNDLMLLTDYGTFNFGSDNIKEIKSANPEAAEAPITKRFPEFKTAVLALSRQAWATYLAQIPATVIDKGMFRNEPYVSFRCNEDYEVNVYGDLKDPAAIEAGVYRKLVIDDSAKMSCLHFIESILGDAADKEVLRNLSHEKDLKVRNGITFEITPPTDEDAYQGWWISVFSEKKLNQSRASEKELRDITIAKAGATKSTKGGDDASSWSAEEMKRARPSNAETISFISSSGEVVTNAEVVRVVDNAYIIWRRGASGGMVRLADLPESLRSRFGYDAAKAAGSYAAEEQRKAQFAQERNQGAPTVPASGLSGESGYSDYVSPTSDGGRVFVNGYTRKDGTYVQSYTRRK
jgi:hypothetical protein